MPGHARRHSAISCAKMAELIDLPFGLWTWGWPKKEQVQSYSPGCANVPSCSGSMVGNSIGRICVVMWPNSNSNIRMSVLLYNGGGSKGHVIMLQTR